MMSETGDDANHESFEIINPNHDAPGPTEHPPPPATASIPNLPPPSALPAFVSMTGPGVTSSNMPSGPPPFAPMGPQAPQAPPKPPDTSAPPTGGNPFSIRAAATSAQPQQIAVPPPIPMTMAMPAPTVMMPTPMPPLTEPPPAQVAYGQQQMQSGVEIPFDILSHGSTLHAGAIEGSSVQQQAGGMWGWFRGAVHNNPLLSKVAETAKSSMDSVIATLDPQMKDYMNNRGLLDIVITLDRDEEIRGMKEGISRVFPASNVRPFVVATGFNAAAQSVGFQNGLQAAQQKATYIRNSGYVDQSSVVIGHEGLIVEESPDVCLYFDCLILDDAARQIQVHAFTQPVEIPREIVQLLKEHTLADYAYKELGYAVSVSHAMTHMWSLGPLEWQERLCGLSRAELLKNAAIALCYSYRGKV